MPDLADVVRVMAEHVKRARTDCGRPRSNDLQSVDGNTVDSTSAHRLPLNRKERYYTGTVLPMLIGSDRFAHLHRFLALCGLDVEPFGRDDEDYGSGIQFFTGYKFFESIFTKEDRARFESDPPTERDTPDLVLVGKDWRLVVQAKMFHKPNPATMTELANYDYPAGHWVHLRTTNPIESTFATVRLRQRVTKGPGSQAAGVAMAFKLIESAQRGWRAVNAPHLVALVRAGAKFDNGKRIERRDESGGDQQVA